MSVSGALNVLPELLPSDAENLAGQDTGRGHLSHSGLSSYLQCPQRFAFQYEHRLDPVVRSVPRELGSAYQKAVELGDPEAGVKELEEAADFPRDQKTEDRLLVESAIVRSASALYLERWGQVETSEFEYRVRLRNPWTGAYSRTFDLLGYADGLTDKGGWWELVENKLVGQITDVQVRKLPLDRQLALERYGVWRATGKHVREIRYRFMRKPSIKLRGGRKKDKSDAETVEQFAARITADYLERPDFYAVEEHLLGDTTDLVRLECELWQWAEQLRASRRARVWTRNSSVCSDFGGCAFLPICTQGDEAAGLYQVRPTRTPTPETETEAA